MEEVDDVAADVVADVAAEPVSVGDTFVDVDPRNYHTLWIRNED